MASSAALFGNDDEFGMRNGPRARIVEFCLDGHPLKGQTSTGGSMAVDRNVSTHPFELI
jgi:hypothetical protein